jgi:bifunctional ADP-heptose synthase (sugar kinase/adenylyltransferase)
MLFKMDLAFFDKLSVLVVGDIILDKYIWGSVKRISPEAPVPIIDVLQESTTVGGAANVASNLSSLVLKWILLGSLVMIQLGREYFIF